MARRAGLPALLAALLAALAAGVWAGPQAAPADACVFLRTPRTYEADSARSLYMSAIDAAAVDALFPGDPFFGLPTIETGARANRSEGSIRRVPVALLRAIAWIESNLTMASRSVPFQSPGLALVSFDCGHGIMQVTTGMTVPLGGDDQPSGAQVSVATHFAHNVARGAAILADKWNRAPQLRPIAGTDTGSSPELIENWYFAVWSYNGFSGPGDYRSNHPADPAFGGWPRSPYRCDGSQPRNRHPYQELVWGCLASPPAPDGRALWQPIAATLPDLAQPQFHQALSPANFQFPYDRMDIPTPRPAHSDQPPAVDPGARARLLASPALAADTAPVVLRTDGSPEQARATIRVRNPGTGLLSWAALPSDSWIVVDPPAGVALGRDVACGSVGCTRDAEVTVTVNPTLLPAAAAEGSLRITSPNGRGRALSVRVDVEVDFEVGAPGTSRAY